MSIDVESAVRERYSTAAKSLENELCCPISYNPEFLKAIPEEVLARDYGCGDPSAHLKPGEIVLDLGSGGGKICFIAAQVVGAEGMVIGVDLNADMLALARSAAPKVAAQIGYDNVEFREGRIQDLTFHAAAAADYLKTNPVENAQDALAYQDHLVRHPLVATGSIDVVVSNCVLNLVHADEKTRLFEEMFRVLRRGGRAVISDIASDEDVPAHMQNDPELWSGCISGAFREDLFLKAFTDAGFYGARILTRDEQPWRTVEGIEFRSLTVEAFKGKEGPCVEGLQAVVYKGPFSEVVDDDGHRLVRGVRMAVCEKTYAIYGREPYLEHFEQVEPREAPETPAEERPFDCSRDVVRSARETKGEAFRETSSGDGACCDDTECC